MSDKPNERALNAFMLALRFRMNQIEAQLQTEESGNKIAFLQGNCAGFRSLCAALQEAGYDDYKNVTASEKTILTFNEKDQEWGITTSKYDVLMTWNTAAYDMEEVMDEAKKPLETRINKRKDWLFYQAEKSRDLYATKGWFCIVSAFDDWCAKIHAAYEIAKKDKERSLDFDDENEGDWLVDEM